MRQLNGIDADMIYGETAASHMHILGLLILDPSTAPRGFGFRDWRRLVASQLEHLPPLRERLVRVPFGLDRPYWADDPDLDLDNHIHHHALPTPGGPRELAALVGELASTKLDQSMPLWTMWFIEGLEHGRVAVLTKLHHACIDGIAGSMMLGRLFTTDREASPALSSAAEERNVAPLPSGSELLVRNLGSLVATPLRAARAARKTATSVGKLIRMRRARTWDTTALPFQAPSTSLNRPITPRRSFAYCSVPLEQVKRVKQAFGVTVNDVVVAICGGALRAYLESRNELPEASLLAAIPVSVRSEDQTTSFGNSVSGMFATLATNLKDPVERLQAVSRGTRSAKELYASGIEGAVMEWARVPRPVAFSMLVRLLSWLDLSRHLPPIFNLLISNVPGPPMPLYAAGAQLLACYPMGPLIDRIALNVTVLSCNGEVGFGFLTCPDVVEDPWAISDRIPEALEELVRAAQRAEHVERSREIR
jgi:diacylglycerol O-acyltransferase